MGDLDLSRSIQEGSRVPGLYTRWSWYGSVLGQRRRRWPSTEPITAQLRQLAGTRIIWGGSRGKLDGRNRGPPDRSVHENVTYYLLDRQQLLWIFLDSDTVINGSQTNRPTRLGLPLFSILTGIAYPENTIHWLNVVLMLLQRLRRGNNINTALGKMPRVYLVCVPVRSVQ